MKIMNVVRKHGAKVGAGSVALAASAETAITAVGADVSTIGYAVLGVLVVAAGFKYMRRAL